MNVTSEIKSYIELKETCGALLLTGKWGCGKSYIMHQLADSLNGEDQYFFFKFFKMILLVRCRL